MDDDFTFGVKEGGGADVVIGGEVYEAPLTEGQPLMEELPPAEAAPAEAPEVSRWREKAELYDSFEPVLQRLGRGEITIQEAGPAKPVPPGPEEMAEYFARVQSPRGAAIHEQIKAYAEMLPPDQKAALDSIPSRYNEVFDTFANVNRPAQRQAGRREVERILRSKELSKDSARGEGAGVMHGNRASFPEDRPSGKEAEIARLKKAIKAHPNDQDLATALASYYTDGL